MSQTHRISSRVVAKRMQSDRSPRVPGNPTVPDETPKKKKRPFWRKRVRRSTASGEHQPVLLAEVLAALDPKPGQVVVDCTLGFAGHAVELLQRVSPDGMLIATDLDAANIEPARAKLDAVGGLYRDPSGELRGSGKRARGRERAAGRWARSRTSACRACRWTTATAGSRSCATARSTCAWTARAAAPPPNCSVHSRWRNSRPAFAISATSRRPTRSRPRLSKHESRSPSSGRRSCAS